MIKVIFLIHIFGILLLFSVIGIFFFNSKEDKVLSPKSKKILMSFHGLSLLLIFIGGTGLMGMNKIKHSTMFSSNTWIAYKYFIWFSLAAMSIFIYKKPKLSNILLFLCFIFALFAALLGKYH